MQNKIVTENSQIDEGTKDLIAVAFISGLLSIPGLVNAEDISKNIPSNATSQQIQTGLKNASPQKSYNGYTALQVANILTRTLYGEAKGESLEGKEMVATVIFNRAGGKIENIPDVCFAKYQFSMWNNFDKKSPSSFTILVPKSVIKNKVSEEAWNECKKITDQIMQDNFKPLGNWNAYLNPITASKKALSTWGSSMTNQKVVGKHKFGYLSKISKKTTPKYPTSYTVQKTDKGVSYIAKNLISSKKTPYTNIKKLTNKIIEINKLSSKAIIHPNDVLKLPLTENFDYLV